MNKKFHISAIIIISFFTSCSTERPHFTEKTIDDQAPEFVWMKSTGDINQDGKIDMLAGGWQKGGMVAYLAPDWKKQIIIDTLKISTDAEVCDIDNNSIPDVVAVADGAIIWLSGPDWKINLIDSIIGHDVEVNDFDQDGLLDVVARNQGAFGKHEGYTLYFYNQKPANTWIRYEKNILNGEGLKMADINNDQKQDIVTNGYWFENTGNMAEWTEHKITDTWKWPNTAIDAADINNDGLIDILFSPSELSGDYYHVSWFEAPKDPSGIWKENIVADSIETVVHSMGVADFDSDGKKDIIIAEMQQGVDPDEVTIFFNQGRNRWEKEVISTGGSHSMRLFDFDGDGDTDAFGANHADHVVKMWVNESNK